MRYVLILDIGKTSVKALVLNDKLETVFEQRRQNQVLSTEPYPHYDVDGIWEWLVRMMTEAGNSFSISAISVTTHGATAALIDRERGGDGLVMPVLDYESSLPESCSLNYSRVRPDFLETRSPNLAAGLNLGRQIYWQQEQYPNEFRDATDILLYPQYWVWRLTGERYSEVTSLGCHTDLWRPERRDYSTLVDSMGWRDRFPVIRPADSIAGTLKASVRDITGFPSTCRVSVGIHDSNASYLRYARANRGKVFSVISTGTWAITMAAGVSCAELRESKDMLANVDFEGGPVACARFMAGREYEALCYRMGSSVSEPFGLEDLVSIVDDGAMAFPQFWSQAGPFAGSEGRIVADRSRTNGPALASVYCALMLDLELDLLGVQGDIYIEGAFVKNRWLCRLLAALRAEQRVFLSPDTTGTVKGAAWLVGFDESLQDSMTLCVPLDISGLNHYKRGWRQVVASMEDGKGEFLK